MAIATFCVIAAVPGHAALRISIATAVACAALEAIHRIALHRGARGVAWVRAHGSRDIEVESADGTLLRGVVRDGSFVAPWLAIVRWRPAGARFDRSLVILPDMIQTDVFRELRVLLRWSRARSYQSVWGSGR